MRIKMIDYTIMIITAEHDNIYAIQYNNPKWNETKCCEFFQLVTKIIICILGLYKL
jgi:hypothetical protein